MSDKHNELLIEEYKVCHERIGRFDSIIWQIAAVLLPLSLAGIFYFGTSDVHSPERLWVTAIAAASSVLLILSWYFLSKQWIKYQRATLHRAREIEETLGLWTYRYTNYVSSGLIQRKEIVHSCRDDEASSYNGLNKYYPASFFIGYPQILTLATWILVVDWAVVVLREIWILFLHRA